MALAQRDGQLHTYAEYLTWPDDMRYELIDGAAYLMAPPASTLDHQDFAGEIYLQLRLALEGKPCRVFIAPVDVRLPKSDGADELVDTGVQPDVLVVCDPSKLDRMRGVRGAPDFAAGLLSPATARHEHVHKRRIYEWALVREYWLVHPTDRIVTIYRLENGKFAAPEVCELSGETPVGVLTGVTISWDDLLRRLPHADW